ncbi:MAG: 50S ribosomal protein L29 [Anaerolineales bacterium]|jgi:large subunit ribosomal protein L29
MMKAADIHKLTTDQIRSELDGARENYFKLRFQYSTGQLTDHSQLNIARRDVARLATILRERTLAAETEGSES